MEPIKVKLKSGKYMRHEEGVLVKYFPGKFVEFDSVFDIPEGFRGQFEIPAQRTTVDDVALEEEPEGPPEPTFTIEHRGGGKYNVVSVATGEAINDELLAKEEALALADAHEQNEPEDG